jgi:MATE family multidrug resistance protein
MKRIGDYLALMRGEDFKGYLSQSWSTSWPMIIIMLFEFLINLTDVYIAGILGKEIQATVGFVSQVYFIFIVVAYALTTGTVSVASRLYTSGNRSALSNSVYTILFSVAVSGLILGVLGIALSSAVIRFLNVPEDIKANGIPLIEIYAGGLLFHYLLISSNGILRSTRMIRNSLKTMALVCFFNILLNFLLVFYSPLGYRGIALSTALSVFIGSVLNLRYMAGLMDRVRIFSYQTIRNVIAIGWPSGLTRVSWQIGSTVLFLIISALPENNVEIIAAFTNGLRIEAAIFLPAFAFNMANAVVIGNLLGERRDIDAFRGGIVTAMVGVVFILILTVITVLNARTLAMFLSHNSVVVDECVRYIYISMISEPFMAWAVIISGGLSGAGDTRGVMGIVVLSQWLIRIPLSFLLGISAGFGAAAIWWSMNMSIFVHAIFVTRRYFKKRWLALE